ncbi:MAG: glucose-6-phosphate dehydrogenase assembly protein OpcA [Verrucomicrobiota bacterium]
MPTDLQFALLGQEVAVANIDGELKKLWEIDNAPTRASLINFALYSESPDSIQSNVETIQEITADHACRSILITAIPEESDSRIRSWITAHCQLDGNGNKTVCSEQIAFLVTNDCTALVRNIVFAHLDSDLPLVFWWQGDLANGFEDDLYSRIDRLIFDSDSWSDLSRGLEALNNALINPRSHFVGHDIAWTRSHYLRRAIAAAFENPALNTKLSSLESISIEADRHHRSTAILLLAWIASRLDIPLSPESLDDPELLFQSSDQGPRASITLTESGLPLDTLTLAFNSGSFTIKRLTDPQFFQMQTRVENFDREKRVPADPTKTSALIVDQLMRGGTNALYHNTLPTTVGLVQWPR